MSNIIVNLIFAWLHINCVQVSYASV